MNANLKLTYSDFEVESPAGDVPRIKINFKIEVGNLSSKDDIVAHIEQINYDVDILSMESDYSNQKKETYVGKYCSSEPLFIKEGESKES